MRRRSDSHERKPAVSRGEASCRAGFRLKRGSRGKNTEQGFAAVIVFVPRERADFFDTLKQLSSFDGTIAVFRLGIQFQIILDSF